MNFYGLSSLEKIKFLFFCFRIGHFVHNSQQELCFQYCWFRHSWLLIPYAPHASFRLLENHSYSLFSALYETNFLSKDNIDILLINDRKAPLLWWVTERTKIIQDGEVQSNSQISVESNLGLHWFALLLCDWSSKNSRHSLNQSDSNRKIVTTWLPAFSRALGSLLVFTLGSHWLDRVFSFLFISRRDNFGFVFYDT